MKPAAQPLNREEWSKLIVGMTLLFGLIERIFPALMVGFPLNDGGMFLVMIRDLRANGFLLPAYTSYNLSSIPYAYPPLGFYIAGLLSALGIPDVELLRWLPILVNSGSILALYLLARDLLKDERLASLAAMVYALVPGNFAWQIMGGGLTRSLGILFILLALHEVYRLFQTGAWKHSGLAALFCSLAVLSHPEVSLATASSCALFWLFFGRTRKGTLQAGLVALGTILLTAPWWGSILHYHGLAPFQAVFFSGAYTGNPLKSFLFEFIGFDIWYGLFRVLVITGLVWNLYKKQFFMLLWMALPYLVEPRSAPAFAYFPFAMVAAQALLEVLPRGIDWLRSRRAASDQPMDFTQQQGFSLLIFTLMFLWFLQGTFYGFLLRNTSLRPPWPQASMTWVRENTPADSQFIILTAVNGVMTDPIQEWFPALAERRSLSTLQGLEWTLGEEFFPRLGQLVALQRCSDTQCLEGWSRDTGLSYGYVLLQRKAGTRLLGGSLAGDEAYKLVYENEAYLIFEYLGATGPLPASEGTSTREYPQPAFRARRRIYPAVQPADSIHG